jgi:hypothetical protein
MEQFDENELRDPVRVSFDEKTGYLVIQLDPAEYGYKAQEAQHQGKTFQPKDELHITVVSREAADEVARFMRKDAEHAGHIHGLIDSIRWSYRKLDRYYHIQKGEEETIIQMVEMPELESFFSELSRITGQGLALPPTHVTLYMRNSEKGIGLPTGETLERLSQGEVRPEEFLPQG